MNQAVLCIAPDITEAEREVATLREAGFSTDDISVLWPDMAGAQELGYEHHTKAPEGIAWGVLFGALFGGLSGYLVFARILWMPCSEPLINAGPVLSVLAGMAAGGSFGYLLGFSIGLAFPEYEAKKYERKIQIGSTLVAVHTDNNDEIKTAEEVLKKAGAFGIHHIEETSRLKRSCNAAAGDETMSKSTTVLLVLGLLLSGLIATGLLTAYADETAPISPSAKRDEQKATMPPDLATPKLPNQPITETKDPLTNETKDQSQSTNSSVKTKEAATNSSTHSLAK